MKELFLNTLASAINAYLGLDAESKQRLIALKGKVITIELLPFHFVYQLHFTENGVTATPGESITAHTHIKSTPLQMLGMLLDTNNRQKFFADDIIMQGNAEVGQQVIALFDELQIDWEEHLSALVGDTPAYHAGRMMKNLSQWLTGSSQSFTQNLSEYVHEEANLFPPPEALQDFFNDIDALRMDVDRIEVKISRLEQSLLAEDDK